MSHPCERQPTLVTNMSLSQGSKFFLERQRIGERVLNETDISDSHLQNLHQYLATPYRNYNATRFTRSRLQDYSRALQYDLRLIKPIEESLVAYLDASPSTVDSIENSGFSKLSPEVQPDSARVVNNQVGNVTSPENTITSSSTVDIHNGKATGTNSVFHSTGSSAITRAKGRCRDAVRQLKNHARHYNCPTEPSTHYRNLKAVAMIGRLTWEDLEIYEYRDSSMLRMNGIVARYREKVMAERDHTDFWEERNSRPAPNSKIPSYGGEYDYCCAIEGERMNPSLTLEAVKGIKGKWKTAYEAPQKFPRNPVLDDSKMWVAAEVVACQASKCLAQKKELVNMIRKIEGAEKSSSSSNQEALPCTQLFVPLTAVPLWLRCYRD